MRSKAIFGLVLLNVVLLGSLFFHNGWIRSASAQVARTPAPSDYLMASGEVQGGNAGVLFIIDTKASKITIRAYNQNTAAFEDMPPIDLSRVFK